MSTGQWFETSTGKSKWIPIIVGFLVLGGVFWTIFASFKKRLQEAKDNGFKVPSWLYAVVFVMFAFYASFGFVPVAQMIFKGNYRRYEYAYLTLSLVSKASLGILVAVGFGQRSKASNPS
jgi:ABC-type proline/glycine betaine transport system permease subunit